MAFSDPLLLKTADVITAATDPGSNYVRIDDDNPNFREYRLVAMSGNERVVQTLRIANYQNGSKFNRRVVVSELREGYDTVTGVESAPQLMSFSMLIDERTADIATLQRKVRRLAHLLANTTDGGILSRLVDGET